MDGTIASYYWDFGDGTNSTEMVATHSYSDSGLYYVKLTVTDSKGASASATMNVFVNNVAPLANAGPDMTVALNQEVTMNASGSMDSDGTIESYNWDCGDGELYEGVVTTHTYTKAGTYAVVLRAMDDDGGVGIDTMIVTVLAPGGGSNLAPLAMAGNDATTIPDSKVGFNGSGSTDADGTIANYTWSFGDGTYGYGATVDHAYTKTGVYAVVLTVTDDKGATGIDVAIVSVQTPPAPPVDLTALQNNLSAIKNDTATLKTDLGKTTSSVDAVKKDTAAVKKDISDTKSASASFPMMLGIVLLVALVAALVLHLVAGRETGALRREVKELKAQGKKDEEK